MIELPGVKEDGMSGQEQRKLGTARGSAWTAILLAVLGKTRRTRGDHTKPAPRLDPIRLVVNLTHPPRTLFWLWRRRDAFS